VGHFVIFFYYLCRFYLINCVGIIVPYRLAFIKRFIYYDELDAWKILDILTDIFFFVDIILNFFTAYFDKNQILETDKRKIAIHYSRTWLFWDILTVFPFIAIPYF